MKERLRVNLYFVLCSVLISACSHREDQKNIQSAHGDQRNYREIALLSSSGFKPILLAQKKVYDLGTPLHRLIRRFDHVIFAQSGGGAVAHEDDFSGAYDEWPTIFVWSKVDKVWKSVQLKNDYARFRWTHIYADQERRRFWALLEFTVAGAGSDVPLLYSEDGAQTWQQISAIPKPHHMARAVEFRMNEKGHGFLKLELDHGVLVDPRGKAGVNRYYKARTENNGRTWSLNLDDYEVDILDGGETSDSVDCNRFYPQWWKQAQPKECLLSPDLLKRKP